MDGESYDEEHVKDEVERRGFDECCGDGGVGQSVFRAQETFYLVAHAEKAGRHESREEEVKGAGHNEEGHLGIKVEEYSGIAGGDHGGGGEALYESNEIYRTGAGRRVKELTYNGEIHTGHESYHPAVVVPDDGAAIQQQ